MRIDDSSTAERKARPRVGRKAPWLKHACAGEDYLSTAISKSPLVANESPHLAGGQLALLLLVVVRVLASRILKDSPWVVTTTAW
ncbi:MAG: hypothetical protein M3O70_07635, partial [Actinomycetota bacterium]|nr:hypothetical protein [Actinomycetota bacterium]